MKLTFASETCTRCGGTGRMPFAVRGGKCFKCHGKGTTLTRAGAAAAAKWSALRDQRTLVPLDTIQPGTVIRHSFGVGAGLVGTVTASATVTEVGPDALNAGCTRIVLEVPERLRARVGYSQAVYVTKATYGALYRPVTAEDIEAFVAAYPTLKSYTLTD